MTTTSGWKMQLWVSADETTATVSDIIGEVTQLSISSSARGPQLTAAGDAGAKKGPGIPDASVRGSCRVTVDSTADALLTYHKAQAKHDCAIIWSSAIGSYGPTFVGRIAEWSQTASFSGGWDYSFRIEVDGVVSETRPV